MHCYFTGKEVLQNSPFSLNLTGKEKLRPLGNQGPFRAENNVYFRFQTIPKMLSTVPEAFSCRKQCVFSIPDDPENVVNGSGRLTFDDL